MNEMERLLQKLTLSGIRLWPQAGKLRYRGPESQITAEVLAQLQQHKTALLQQLSEPSYAALSYGQKGLWYIQQSVPDAFAYHVALGLRITSLLDLALLQNALQLVVNRHAALRTTFPVQEHMPIQKIAGYQEAAFTVVDATACTEDEVLAQVKAAHEQPFALADGPLLRVWVFAHAPQDHILLISAHHIVIDGWSVYLLLDELFTFYQALQRREVAQLPLAEASFADYVDWQQALLRTEGDRLLAYWQAQLADPLPVLQLPTDHQRPAQQTYRGITCAFTLPPSLTQAVKRLAQQQGCTLYMVLLAAYQLLLHRYSGQDDLLVGLPTAGRSRPEFAQVIGYFTAPVVLRTAISDSLTFAQVLAQVRSRLLAAFDHQDYPFPLLVEAINPVRDPGRAPLYQADFVLQKPHRAQELVLAAGKIEYAGLTLEKILLPVFEGQLDLSLEMIELPAGLYGEFKARSDLFVPATIERMIGHFQELLKGIVDNPEQPIRSLPLLTAAERQQILVEWNNTQTDYPKDKCIHQLFEEQATRTPDAVAVVAAMQNTTYETPAHKQAGQQALTYRELNERTNQLAHYLQSLGVGPETLVGICVERSIEMVVGLLGILKAGGAYVPLDPTYPAERLAFMLADTRTALVLTEARLQLDLPGTVRTLCLDTEWERVVGYPMGKPTSNVNAENLAYIMYTSGSTGQPKGICTTQRNVVRLVQNTNFAQLSDNEVFLQLAPITFDAATFEIWGALLNGGRLVIMPPGQPSLAAIDAAIQRYQITTLWLTAGLFHLMVDQHIEGLRPLRQLLAGGDVLSVVHVQRFLQTLPHCQLINGYGPTENTTFTCCYAFSARATFEASVPIGRPIANTQVYILDQQMQPVPIGVTGELYAGGAGVARAYLNRPELTAEKFIANPFGAGRLYKTGDLARWRPDGNLEFLGRMDQQVKVRGFRVEPGEIEIVLAHHPAVQEAVVIAREDMPGEKRLVAYVVPDKQTSRQADKEGGQDDFSLSLPVSVSDLRSYLQAKLPDYMLPSAFVRLEALPLTANGKVDRKALPAPLPAIEVGSEQTAPRTAAEATLAAIWREVLRVPAVGMEDNFFALGGHSLLATQVVSRIRQAFAVELSLHSLFQGATVRNLAAEVSSLQQAQQQVLQPALTPVSRDQALPLSFAQARMWFLAQMEGSNQAYHVPLALEVTGPLNVTALQQSWQTMVARHEGLRTQYRRQEGLVEQVILATIPFTLNIETLLTAQAPSITAWLTMHTEAPFDLAEGVPWRLHLLQVADDQHILLLVLHHIAADGWSVAVLWREWRQLYAAAVRGETVALPPLPIQFADYALWQRQWLTGAILDEHLHFWRQHLAGAPALLALPTDRPRPAVQGFRGAHITFTLNAQLTAGIQSFCVQAGVTPFMALLATFQILLYRYSGQSDIVVGTPIANRTQIETEGVVGMFVNTLALRSHLADNATFTALLAQVRATTQAAYDHQSLPFELLVEALQPVRTLSHAPLFQVMFVLQNTPPNDLTLPGVTLRALDPPVTTAKFDMTLTLLEDTQGMSGWWEYDCDLFEAATIERMIGHFQTLLASIVANPAQQLGDLPLLTAAERQQLLVTWNNTQTAYPADAGIHHLFAEQAARTPDAVAVVLAEGPLDPGDGPMEREAGQPKSLTYGELNARANQLAHYLQRLGVGPNRLVGLCVERSLEMVVGLLGILKAGGAYVPLDPTYPPERLAFMLQDAAAPVLLTQAHLRQQLPATATPVICLDHDWPHIVNQHGADPGTDKDLPNGGVVYETDLAYVIYTSGSTGQPKGALNSQRGLCNVLRYLQDHHHLTAADKTLQTTVFSFDVATSELFWPLLNGASLVLTQPNGQRDPGYLVAMIQRHRITTLHLVPSLLQVLLEEPAITACTTLKRVIVAGEALSVALQNLFLARLPHAQLHNLYGPTETSIYVTAWPCQPQLGQLTVPIGRPIANTQIYVLDRQLQPVPIGVPGELHIGGLQVGLGYHNRPELTAEKFITNPFGTGRLYKTGDLARWRPDGNLEYLGRMDHQVKLRGFRIELGEIESVLAQHPAVREAIVIAAASSTSDQRLVAYVILHDQGQNGQMSQQIVDGTLQGQPSTDAFAALKANLYSHLQQKLPTYMLPAVFIVLDAWPLNPNGKLDRQALPRPAQQDHRQAARLAPPQTALEEALVRIWSELLGVEQVGILDDFFALGGHSLLLLQLQARLRQNLQIEVPLRYLFEKTTLADLAAFITTLQAVMTPLAASTDHLSTPVEEGEL